MNIRKHYEFHAQWDSLVDLHLDKLYIIWVNELEPITRKKKVYCNQKKKKSFNNIRVIAIVDTGCYNKI